MPNKQIPFGLSNALGGSFGGSPTPSGQQPTPPPAPSPTPPGDSGGGPSLSGALDSLSEYFSKPTVSPYEQLADPTKRQPPK